MRAHDRRFVVGAVALAVAATPPAILAGRGGGGAPKGCVAVTEPGFMGAQTKVTCLNRRTRPVPVGKAR